MFTLNDLLTSSDQCILATSNLISSMIRQVIFEPLLLQIFFEK